MFVVLFNEAKRLFAPMPPMWMWMDRSSHCSMLWRMRK